MKTIIFIAAIFGALYIGHTYGYMGVNAAEQTKEDTVKLANDAKDKVGDVKKDLAKRAEHVKKAVSK